MSDSDSLTPVMDRSNFDRIVAALLELRPRPKQLISFFAPEAHWRLNGDPASWAYAGERSSRDSIIAYLEAFLVEFEQLEIRHLITVVEDEQACVQYEMRVRHRGTRRSDIIPCLCFIRVEGELIVEVNEFIDSATLFGLRNSRFR